MPHKRVAAAAADRCDPVAARCDAVNTLAVRDGEVSGYNTDVSGVRMLLDRMNLPADCGVLVLGAGGAAAAALVACEGRPLALSARDPGAAGEVSSRVGVEAALVPWGEPVPGALVVNSTPLGMSGEPLPDGIIAVSAGVLEMAYGAGETPAVAEALRRGLAAADGIDLLVAQAAGSFALWTGLPAPLEVMEAAARA
jgi:shikimate dehydrogenase